MYVAHEEACVRVFIIHNEYPSKAWNSCFQELFIILEQDIKNLRLFETLIRYRVSSGLCCIRNTRDMFIMLRYVSTVTRIHSVFIHVLHYWSLDKSV